jgi:hypothetical protein
MPRTIGTTISTLACAALVLAGLPQPAAANHGNHGTFGPAVRSCAPEDANVVTSGGVPGCTDPRAVSDCLSDPAGALRLSLNARTRFVVRPRDETIAQIATQEYTYFRVKGVEDCAGNRFTGDLNVAIAYRLTVQDPQCPGGLCTVPDFDLPHAIRCVRGSCRARISGSEGLSDAGSPSFPATMPWTAELLGIRFLDLAGRPVLTPGLTLALGRDELPYRLPLGGGRFEGRLVPAYAACAPGNADATTSAGLPACAPVPLSDCAVDPAGAVRLGANTRRNKVGLIAGGGAGLRVRGSIAGLEDCAGDPYEGTVALVVTVRATVEEPYPGGPTCSTVDHALRLPLGVSDGDVRLRFALGLGIGGQPIGLEIIRVELLDDAERAIAVAPGFKVSCREGRCFGD